MNTPLSIFAVATLTLTSAMHSFAVPQNPEFIIHAPDTTGIPGQASVMFARFAPDGDLWVSARQTPIWIFGGIGIYNGDTWTTYSNRSTPLQEWNYQVQWDSAGDAWVACENRIVKINGDNPDSWTILDPSNSPLVGDRNWDVAIDQTTGHIWVANADIDQVQGGLFEFDPVAQQWTHHDEPFMRSYFGISKPISVFVRSNGQVWATFDFLGGNARRDPVSGTWTHQQGPQILEWAERSDGTLYGVSGTGTYRYNEATQSWNLIVNYNSNVIAIDSQDRIFVGRDSNVYRFANSAWTLFIQGPSDVKSIDFGPDGDIWVCYEHSVRQYAADGTGKHIYSSVITGIGEYILDNIERDNEGNLWTMASITGATRFDGAHYRNFSQYGHEETNPFQVGGTLLCTNVEDVFQDNAGNIWFAANGVARSADLENWNLWYWGNANLPYDHLTAIGQDANGDIWAGSNGSGIFRFDGSAWHYRELGPSYDSQRVREIVTATDGVMWTITYTGVHRFDGVNWTFIPAYTAQIPSMPLDLAAGLNGDVWIATAGGLVHHDGTSWQVYGPHNAPFMHARISCVAVREDGLVAACSDNVYNWPYSGDLCLFDGTQWAQFPGGYGNPNPFYQSNAMEFDRDGHLWIAQVNFGAVQVIVGPTTTPLPGDITGDGTVNVNDLLAVIYAWGACPTPPAGCPADISPSPNGNGVVNVSDLLMVINNWG